jgi:hypothetical protein
MTFIQKISELKHIYVLNNLQVLCVNQKSNSEKKDKKQ